MYSSEYISNLKMPTNFRPFSIVKSMSCLNDFSLEIKQKMNLKNKQTIYRRQNVTSWVRCGT